MSTGDRRKSNSRSLSLIILSTCKMITSRRWIKISSWSENRSIPIREDEIMPKARIKTSMRRISSPRCLINDLNLEESIMKQATLKKTSWICNKSQWMTYIDSWWNSKINRKSTKNRSSLDKREKMAANKTLKYWHSREWRIKWERIKLRKVWSNTKSKKPYKTKMENVAQKAAIYILAKLKE